MPIKFVNYSTNCSLEIDYQQCADLDDDKMAESELLEEPVAPDRHMAAFDPKDVQSRHEGYGLLGFGSVAWKIRTIENPEKPAVRVQQIKICIEKI